jgi:hypothetical protein
VNPATTAKALVTALSIAAAAPASAQVVPQLEASFGFGWFTPVEDFRFNYFRRPVSVMLAPGIGVAPVPVKAELGVLATMGDTFGTRFDLDLRPMLVVEPPRWPLYLRAMLDFRSMLYGPRRTGYGGALGHRFGVAGVDTFLEGGFLVGRVMNYFTAPSGHLLETPRDKVSTDFEFRLGVRL